MTEKLSEENKGRATISFTLARGPLSPEERAEFIQGLAKIAGVPAEEIKFIRQYEAPCDNCKNDSTNGGGPLTGPQI